MSATIRWAGTLTSTSSLAHGGQSRGTITLLRREAVVQPDGQMIWLPLVSGNAVKGRLRRIGEELLREALDYEGQLTLQAAAFLAGGGSMSKTGREPLTGERLRRLRQLVPQVGVFGGAAGSRIIDGALQVGKMVPLVREAAAVLERDDVSDATAFGATQLELYTRTDTESSHAIGDVADPSAVPLDLLGRPLLDEIPPAGGPMMWRVETFPAGTRFDWWVQLQRGTDLEVAFFRDVLATFVHGGQIGGRASIGHGRFRAELTQSVLIGRPGDVDWRQYVAEHRDDALEVLQWLT